MRTIAVILWAASLVGMAPEAPGVPGAPAPLEAPSPPAALESPEPPGVRGVLAGLVLDESGTGIPGANLVVEGTLVGTATDVDGRFRLENLPSGPFELKVSAVGFHTVRQTFRLGADEERMVEIVLTERVLESDEVVVSASRREQPALSVPVSVETLSAEDLLARNVVVLDDALRTVSGVQLQGNQINIRGSSGFAYNTGSRVLVMLDGMPLLSPETDGVPFSALPMSEIERIEILKGPGSALYGGGALGGIINLITRAAPDDPETRIRTYAGAYQPARHAIWRHNWDGGDRPRFFTGGAVTHSRRFSERMALWVNVSARRDTGYLDFDETTEFHGFTKLSFRPRPSYRMDVLAGVAARKYDTFLFWNSGRDALRPGSLAIGGPSGNDTPTGTTDSFTHQITLLPSFTHLLGSSVYYTVKGRLFGLVLRPIDEDGNPRPVSSGTLGFRYGGEAQASWAPRVDRQVTAGVSVDAITTESSFFVTEDGDRLNGQPEGAVFLHVEEAPTEKLHLVGGLRLDTYRLDATRSETRLSPKLSASYDVVPGLTVRAAFGDGFRVPSFAERFTDNRDFFPIVRNLDLRPEKSRSFEAGLRTRRVWDGAGSMRFDIAGFHTLYEDLIEPKLLTGVQAFQFVNLTEARITGFESTLE
ncbi:MAG: TonB-dependent receptor, partial [Rhodothermales bacterium]|nr:TonB-dependent receptor [Rhodothermales bacterium]